MYLSYYKGQTRSISVQATSGERIEFPAEHVRQYVSHDGVRGLFEICFDDQQRFISLTQITL